jgi:signal transduction histidine kinase
MVGEERALSEIVARLVASRLDQFCMMQEYRRMAVAEERVRVGRDLHDSILQSLTGAALQLKTVARVMEKDPERARGRIAEIQEIIAADQRELRWFIDQLQERAQISMDGEPYDIAARMKFLVHRFRQHWDLDVRYELDPLIQLLPGTLRAEVFALISEGVANAAKHASPSRVWVEVKAAGRSVEIRVEDDGHGFPFVGRYDLSELVESKRGPVTLKERVMSLNGSMSIDSATDGSRIDIRIPMAAEVM